MIFQYFLFEQVYNREAHLPRQISVKNQEVSCEYRLILFHNKQLRCPENDLLDP